jgi:hypothetical protein
LFYENENFTDKKFDEPTVAIQHNETEMSYRSPSGIDSDLAHSGYHSVPCGANGESRRHH